MRYAISGVAFSGNKGAEGMLLALIQNLRKWDDAAEFSVFSYYPATDRAASREAEHLKICNAGPKHVVLAFFPALWTGFCRKLHLPQWFWKYGFMRQVADCDLWLDAAGISFGDGREKFTIFNILTFFPALSAGVPVVKAAQALGPFEHRSNRMLAKLFLPHLALIAARGDRSRAYVDGLNLSNVVTFSDVAFSLDCTDAERERARQLLPLRDGRPRIGISPSQVVSRLCAAKGMDYCGILCEVIQQCVKRNWHCILFAHSARQGSGKLHNNDLPLLSKLRAALPPDLPITVLDQEMEAGELRALIGGLDVLVASRFHAIISAMATGVPAAVIGWSHKYEEVLAPFELSASVRSYDRLDAMDTITIVEKLLLHREELSAGIRRESQRIAGQNREFFARIVEMAQKTPRR